MRSPIEVALIDASSRRQPTPYFALAAVSCMAWTHLLFARCSDARSWFCTKAEGTVPRQFIPRRGSISRPTCLCCPMASRSAQCAAAMPRGISIVPARRTAKRRSPTTTLAASFSSSGLCANSRPMKSFSSTTDCKPRPPPSRPTTFDPAKPQSAAEP